MLLILAGVSISLVVGQNGVLTRATDSSKATKYSQMKEAVGLAVEDIQTEYFNVYRTDASAEFSTYLTEEKLAAALNSQGYELYTGAVEGTGVTDSTKVAVTATTPTAATGVKLYVCSKDSKKDFVEFRLTANSVGATAEYGSDLGKADLT